MTTRLTDEEALALASLLGRSWPSVLPTVDVTSSEDVAHAIRRGVRSLGVRQLVLAPTDGEPTGSFHQDLQPLVDAVGAGSRRRVVVLQQMGATPPHHASGVVLIAFDDDATERTLLDVISSTGIHEVAPMPSGEAHEVIAETLRTAFRDGVSAAEPGTELALLVTVLTDKGPVAARVTRGACDIGGFDVVSGAPTFVASTHETTAEGMLAAVGV